MLELGRGRELLSVLQRKDGSCILTITYLGVTGRHSCKDYNVYVVLVLLPGWKEENIRTSCYLANNFRGVSDMHHGRGDLQPREVLSFHCHLKVLLILFLSAANIEEWEIYEASGSSTPWSHMVSQSKSVTQFI